MAERSVAVRNCKASRLSIMVKSEGVSVRRSFVSAEYLSDGTEEGGGVAGERPRWSDCTHVVPTFRSNSCCLRSYSLFSGSRFCVAPVMVTIGADDSPVGAPWGNVIVNWKAGEAFPRFTLSYMFEVR